MGLCVVSPPPVVVTRTHKPQETENGRRKGDTCLAVDSVRDVSSGCCAGLARFAVAEWPALEAAGAATGVPRGRQAKHIKLAGHGRGRDSCKPDAPARSVRRARVLTDAPELELRDPVAAVAHPYCVRFHMAFFPRQRPLHLFARLIERKWSQQSSVRHLMSVQRRALGTALLRKRLRQTCTSMQCRNTGGAQGNTMFV